MTRQHLEQWEAENGRIEESTFVALRTDWSKRWPDIEQFENRDLMVTNIYQVGD